MTSGVATTGVNFSEFDATVTVCTGWASCETAPATCVTESLATPAAADASKDSTDAGAAAMSEGASAPPHAASEMQSESALNDMKRWGSGASVIIGGL